MARSSQRWILGFCLLLAATPLLAQSVYQWKDAKGVTHYSDAPPPEGTSTVREISHGAQPTLRAAANTPEADNAQCAQARLNAVRLQGNAEVGLDADRDGTPDAVMGAEERARQVELARAAIKTHCPGGR